MSQISNNITKEREEDSFEGLCRSCGEELQTAHKFIGICSFCVSAKKKKVFPQIAYGARNGR